jgi:Leu/Phe-tRNA-protein transferase
MEVSSLISKYRGVIVTVEKHKNCDGTLSLHATIDGQVFRPAANDSFKSIVKECRAEIDHWIDEQKASHSQKIARRGYCNRASSSAD